jgi:hypothetical protein
MHLKSETHGRIEVEIYTGLKSLYYIFDDGRLTNKRYSPDTPTAEALKDFKEHIKENKQRHNESKR